MPGLKRLLCVMHQAKESSGSKHVSVLNIFVKLFGNKNEANSVLLNSTIFYCKLVIILHILII